MQVDLGNLHAFQMENYESLFKVPTVERHSYDDLANVYKLINHGGDYSEPEPEGFYHRILYKNSLNIYCIQYYVYWIEQNCLGLLPIADQKYDYEHIFVYVKAPVEFPVGIVNGGYSKGLGPILSVS